MLIIAGILAIAPTCVILKKKKKKKTIFGNE
jgi:hypothetical protein